MSFHRPTRLTAAQKKELASLGYDPKQYLICYQVPNSMVLKHKKTGDLVVAIRNPGK